MAQPLALGAQLVLRVGAQSLRRGGERAQLVEPRRRGVGVARDLLVAPPRGGQLAPGRSRLGPSQLVPGERVEHVELVRRPRETALLELAGHGEQPLHERRHVLARCAPPPGVGARAAVREDAARDDEAVLVLRPQLGERLELVLVEQRLRQVELRLDVCLVRARPDVRRVAARAEQQPDRLRQDRLARAGLAGDRVQPGRELELGLADQDEVLDPEAAKHRAGW